jgi:hypothetical protein
MEVSFRPGSRAQAQPRGLHGGHRLRILKPDHGGLGPVFIFLNPAAIPTMPYEYLFCHPTGD